MGGAGDDGSSDGPDSSTFADPLNLSRIDKGWQFPALDSREVVRKLGAENRDISQYICNVLGKAPLCIRLKTKAVTIRAGSGPVSRGAAPVKKFRAQVTLGSHEPKDLAKARRLRSVWSVRTQAQSGGGNNRAGNMRATSREVLEKSYEEYMSKLFPHFDLEVILPKTKACKGGNPVILYTAPVAPGSTQDGSRVCQGEGTVVVFPNGRKRNQENQGIEIGPTSLHLHGGPSVVDTHWVRGRKFFWKGRSVGQV